MAREISDVLSGEVRDFAQEAASATRSATGADRVHGGGAKEGERGEAKESEAMKRANSQTTAYPRRALIAGGLGLGPLIVARRVLGGAGYQAPSDKITLGFIGTGEHGIGTNIGGFPAARERTCEDQLVAVCDVDSGA